MAHHRTVVDGFEKKFSEIRAASELHNASLGFLPRGGDHGGGRGG